MKCTAVVLTKKKKARLFKSGEVTIATRNQTVGKNLNEFNVRVVDYNYKHVKILYIAT